MVSKNEIKNKLNNFLCKISPLYRKIFIINDNIIKIDSKLNKFICDSNYYKNETNENYVKILEVICKSKNLSNYSDLGLDNNGERLVPGYSHEITEVIRHKSTYSMFREIIFADIVNNPSILKNKINILDLGSGTGHGSYLLSSIPNSIITSIEIEPKAIEFAKDNYFSENIKYINSSIEGYLDNSVVEYDYVVSRHAIEHVNMDIKKIVNKIKFSNRLMISVPYCERPGNEYHIHLNINEKSFPSSGNIEFIYEDLGGNNDLIIDKNKIINSFSYILSKNGLGRISDTIKFPFGAYKFMGLEKLFFNK